MLREPATREEFLDALEEAMGDMEDLIVCSGEEETDEMVGLIPTLTLMGHELKQLQTHVESGEHAFADGKDLAFMNLARTYRRVIPFFSLLDALNRAHLKGVS
jgi:hypothetical protein